MLKPSGRFRGNEVVDAGRKHLEPEELKRVFAAKAISKSLFWNAYFRLQYYYGCRISEPAITFQEDVSFETSQIIVRRLKKRQFGTKVVEENGKKRRVRDDDNKVSDGYEEYVYTLPPALLEVLRQHLAAVKENKLTNKSPWLFPSERKPRKVDGTQERMTDMRRTGNYSAVSRWHAEKVFLAATKEAGGIPEHLCHSHVLRHTRATLLLAEGAPESDVKDLLGHASISTTHTYLGAAKSLKLRLHTTAQLGLGEGW